MSDQDQETPPADGDSDLATSPAGPARRPQGNGAIHLFCFAGIDVWLHYSWFIVAVLELSIRKNTYHSPIWNAAEYLALFAIVLLHEFGHAFACRSTGGKANRIMLWPLGGIAYVQPPQRAGAMLWSIAAGPLVNVALLPVTWMLFRWGVESGWGHSAPDLLHWVYAVKWMNLALLIFNMLPVYPLDGGQIARALLWFVIGRANSLYVMALLGFPAGIAMTCAAIYYLGGLNDIYNLVWSVAIGAFVLSRSTNALKYARKLKQLEKMPRVEGQACPSCRERPLSGDLWMCDQCQAHYNPFNTNNTCPQCGKTHEKVQCPFCFEWSELPRWRR